MKEKTSTGQYERIEHSRNSLVKANVTSIGSSAYHWHYDYELLFVLRGSVEVRYGLYGSESSTLRAGDMIMINPKGVHEVLGMTGDNLVAFIQFSEKLLEDTPEGMQYYFFLNSTRPDYQPSKVYYLYGRLVARICLAQRNTGRAASLRRKAWTYLLLTELVTGVQYELRTASPESEGNTELVMKISSFIDKNLQEEHLTEAVCRNFGLSEKGIYLLLKDVVGLTLREMVDAARIEKACSMLQNPSIPLPVVSDICGYSGEATFYRRFKAALGVTPGEYRKGIHTAQVDENIQNYLSTNEAEVDQQLRYWAELGDWSIG